MSMTPEYRFKKNDGSPYPDWVRRKFGELYTERNDRGDESLPILSVSIHSGVSGDEMDEDELGKRVNRSEDKSLYKRVSPGDLVFNMMRAWQGAIGTVKTEGMVSPAYITASPSDEVYPPFMDYFMRTDEMIHVINRQSYGVTDFRKRLYWDSFANIDCMLPSIEEQKRITEFLYTLDVLIEEKGKEIEKLKQYKTGIMRSIFRQDYRFKDENGKNFPDWTNYSLGDVLIEYNEKASKGKEYEHVSLTKEGVVPKTDRYDRDFLVTQDDKQYRVTHYDDICYNPANLKFGVICRNKYGDAIFSPIYVTFKVNKGFLPAYIEAYLVRWDFIVTTLKYQQGTVYERMAVSSKDLLSMDIAVPCFDEQKKIAEFLTALDDQIENEEGLLNDYIRLKKGYEQKMLI